MSEAAVTEPSRRPGRPSDADSSATRVRILTAARRAFANGGYDATTNKMIAESAGLTAAALYHYFPSKADIYLATSEAVHGHLAELFRAGDVAGLPLAGRIRIVVSEVERANAQDPTIAAFLVGLTEEARRHPDIALALAPVQIRLHTEVASMVRGAPDCDEVIGASGAPVFADLFIGALGGLARLSLRAGDPGRLGSAMELLVDLVRRAGRP